MFAEGVVLTQGQSEELLWGVAVGFSEVGQLL